jgi:hypothetical protein
LHQIDRPLQIETVPPENPADIIIQYGGVHAGHGVAAEAESRTPTWIPERRCCGRVGGAGSWEDAWKLDLWYWIRFKWS